MNAATHTTESKRIMRDMLCFILWAKANNTNPETILFTIAHDLNGILNADKSFSPLTNGYTKKIKDK